MKQLEIVELAAVTGGYTSSSVRQLWAAGEATRWNNSYRATYERSIQQGVPRGMRNSLAVEHADYLHGRSRYPAASVPYVTVGPHAIR